MLKEIKIKRDDTEGLHYEMKGIKKEEEIKKIVEVWI